MSPRKSTPEHPGAGSGLGRRALLQRVALLGLGSGPLAALLSACDSGQRQGAVDAAAPTALGPLEKELHIYNWSDYIAEDTVPGFEKEFGVRVTYDIYENNEEMLAKLQAGASGYDLVVPSGYVIPVMAATHLLTPLSRNYLTNWDNLAPIFQGLPSDPENTWSVPWQWGTTGIAYRTDKIAEPPTSWAVFHDPRYAQKATMMDDAREVIGAMLLYRGHSLNSTDAGELAAAKADAILAKQQLKAYLSAPVKSQLIAGDVWMSQLWNGDTAQARKEQPNIGYALPREGATIWQDSLVIPRRAPHPRAAHEFINYILRPEVGAKISEFTGYGTPNQSAAQRMSNALPYPSAEELKRLEYPRDLGESTALWDQIWTEIKSA
jgi:spermidine/putrescine transport system substrate-binding protein